MFESSKLPKIIVDIINENFDMVLVPDKFLIGVYKFIFTLFPFFIKFHIVNVYLFNKI